MRISHTGAGLLSLLRPLAGVVAHVGAAVAHVVGRRRALGLGRVRLLGTLLEVALREMDGVAVADVGAGDQGAGALAAVGGAAFDGDDQSF